MGKGSTSYASSEIVWCIVADAFRMDATDDITLYDRDQYRKPCHGHIELRRMVYIMQ